MSYFVEIPLNGDDVMLVEVTGQVHDIAPAGRGRDVVGRLVPEALAKGLDRVRSFAGNVLARMRSCPEPPDVVTVEFGLKLAAKTGVFIAESSGEAHVKVTMQWNRATGDSGESKL